MGDSFGGIVMFRSHEWVAFAWSLSYTVFFKTYTQLEINLQISVESWDEFGLN